MDRNYRDFLAKSLDDVTQNFISKYEILNTGKLTKWSQPNYSTEEIDQFLKSEFGGVYDGYNPLIGEYVHFIVSRPIAQLQLWCTIDNQFKTKLGGLNGKPISMLVFNLFRSQCNYVEFHNNREILVPFPISLLYGNIKDDHQDKRWEDVLHFQMNVGYLDDLLKRNQRASQGISALVLGSSTINRIDSATFKSYWDIYPQIEHPRRDFYPALLASAFVFEKLFKGRINSLSFKPRVEFETVSCDYIVHLDVVSSILQDRNRSILERNKLYFNQIVPSNRLFHLPKKNVSEFYERELDIAFASALKIHGIKAPFTLVAYTLKSGDSWEQVANSFNVRKQELLKINCLNFQSCDITKLLIPVPIKDSLFYSAFDTLNFDGIQEQLKSRKDSIGSIQVEIKPTIPVAPVASKTYTVKSGDTLSAIARKYRVSVRQLKSWNKLKSDNLQIGQKLVVRK